ncbi:MAG: hypothetical protein FJ004_02780 [Chloroflexi bacterium]|nr:hypothetical protein [Chloroflexota bacterium]
MYDVAPVVIVCVLGTVFFTAGMPFLLRPIARWSEQRTDGNRKGRIGTIVWGTENSMGPAIGTTIVTNKRYREERHLIGFIDDDKRKVGRKVKVEFPHSAGKFGGWFPVIGIPSNINRLVEQFQVDEVIVGIENPDQNTYESVKAFCERTKILFTDARYSCKCVLPEVPDEQIKK